MSVTIGLAGEVGISDLGAMPPYAYRAPDAELPDTSSRGMNRRPSTSNDGLSGRLCSAVAVVTA